MLCYVMLCYAFATLTIWNIGLLDTYMVNDIGFGIVFHMVIIQAGILTRGPMTHNDWTYDQQNQEIKGWPPHPAESFNPLWSS